MWLKARNVWSLHYGHIQGGHKRWRGKIIPKGWDFGIPGYSLCMEGEFLEVKIYIDSWEVK